jgi:hypothetical protein
MDIKEFKNKLTQSTKQAFIEIQLQHPTEKIYSFALCNNDATISIHPSANSTEYLDKFTDDDDFYFYKYEPSEWKFEYKGAENAFKEINDYCRNIVEQNDDDEDWFYQFQHQINEKCIEVLEDLKHENFFAENSENEIFLNFSVIDEDLPKQKQIEIIQKLNDQSYKDDYFEWMKSWDKNKKRAL